MGFDAGPLFCAAGVTYYWVDFWEFLKETGVVTQLARQANKPEQLLTSEELENAINEIRYTFNLIAADETEQWLAERGCGVDELVRYAKRHFVSDLLVPDDTCEIASGSSQVNEKDLLAEGFLSGKFNSELKRYAALVAKALEQQLVLERNSLLQTLLQVERAHLATTSSHTSIIRELQLHFVEWTILRLLLVEFDSIDPAREFYLWVNYDRVPFYDACSTLGFSLLELSLRVEECPEGDFAEKVAVTPANEIISPFTWGTNKYGVAQVLLRQTPHYSDPASVICAEEAIKAREKQRLIESHVSFCETSYLQEVL